MPTFTCTLCDQVEDGCECTTCSSCSESYGANSSSGPCDSCSRCSDCGCRCCSICDGDPDDCGCCRNCDNTEGNCECCGHCGNPDCDCRYCEGCNETVYSSSWGCSDCERCEDCGCECDEGEDGDLDRPARPAQLRPVSPLPTWYVAPEIVAPVYEVLTVPSNYWFPLGPIEAPLQAPIAPPAPSPPARRCSNCSGLKLETEFCTSNTTCKRYNYCLQCCGHAHCQHGNAGKCSVCKLCNNCCQHPKCKTCATKDRALCEVCENCLICCTCLRCNRFAYYEDPVSHIIEAPDTKCSGCDNCSHHCKCPKCTVCEKKGSLCVACTNCEQCCAVGACGAMSRGRDFFPYKKREFQFFNADNIALRKVNPSKRHISVELETNRYENRGRGNRLHKALEKWQDSVVEDGSIGSGREINTNPSAGDKFLEHMRELCDGLGDLEASASDKCGMHVHINAKDISTYELRRVILLYERIERALFDACHPRRLNYQYALKCGHFFTKNLATVDPKGFKAEIYGALYNGGVKLVKPSRKLAGAPPSYYSGEQKANYLRHVRHQQLVKVGERVREQTTEKSHSLRYRALNLHSYFLRGSIEFRHHEGTTDYNTIVGFGRVCAEIISKASALTEKQIASLPRNSRRALIAILPKDLQEYIVEAWNRNDLIKNNTPYQSYKENYLRVWGL